MSYTALYREWRPQNFEQVVGQAHVVRTLTNAIRDDQLSHAYLFAGPRGTGKTSIARILAKAINCEAGPTPEPCGSCASCMGIASGTAMDVIEIDAASNRGINEIRDLREKVRYSPAHCRHKVYIIDEVHMLTPEAFNALLKTLEDPPSHVFFLMATTESHKIPLTILSRLQRFDFHRLKTGEIVSRLREICQHHGIEADDATLQGIARQADGALRDALSLLDQCRSFAGDHINLEDVAEVLGTAGSALLVEIADSVREGDLAGCLSRIAGAEDDGKDIRVLTRDLLLHFRNVMVAQAAGRPADVPEDIAREIDRQADSYDPRTIVDIIDALSEAESRMRLSPHPRVLLEVTLMGLIVKTGLYRHRSEDSPEPEEPKAQEAEQVVEARDSKPSSDGASAPPETQGDQAAPDTAAPAPNGEDAWEDFRQELKRVRRGLHALLEPARLLGVEKERVTIGFPGEYTFHKERTEENARLMSEILSRVMGRQCRIECTLISSAGSDDKSSRRGPESDPPPRHKVQGREEARTDDPAPKKGSGPGDQGAAESAATQEQEAIEIFSGRLVDEEEKRG